MGHCCYPTEYDIALVILASLEIHIHTNARPMKWPWAWFHITCLEPRLVNDGRGQQRYTHAFPMRTLLLPGREPVDNNITTRRPEKAEIGKYKIPCARCGA